MKIWKDLQCFFNDRLYTKFTPDVGTSSLEWRNAVNVGFENICTRRITNLTTIQVLMMFSETNMYEGWFIEEQSLDEHNLFYTIFEIFYIKTYSQVPSSLFRDTIYVYWYTALSNIAANRISSLLVALRYLNTELWSYSILKAKIKRKNRWGYSVNAKDTSKRNKSNTIRKIFSFLLDMDAMNVWLSAGCKYYKLTGKYLLVEDRLKSDKQREQVGSVSYVMEQTEQPYIQSFTIYFYVCDSVLIDVVCYRFDLAEQYDL